MSPAGRTANVPGLERARRGQSQRTAIGSTNGARFVQGNSLPSAATGCVCEMVRRSFVRLAPALQRQQAASSPRSGGADLAATFIAGVAVLVLLGRVCFHPSALSSAAIWLSATLPRFT
jgi:hypothetical protein